MGKLSVVIPSRDERFLVPTIEDIFRNARGEIEVVAVLDSDKWPDNWAEVTAKYPNLHTVHNGKSLGMRASINRGVASAISRRAKFIMKTDAHCSFSEGFDEVLKAECEPNWVVIPRRGRLDPEQWIATDTHKPDIDYHYLSFPDDPNDFGGPGLNGKVWVERALQRKDILLDEEMSSQGSAYFLHAKYFTELELMDEANYGGFWSEFQEVGLKCWLSGGQVMINKKAKYLHLHKGRKYGRGYKLAESELVKGSTYAKKWLFNEAWPKQTLPFRTLIYRFWPVPTWPDNWDEILYQGRQYWPIGLSSDEMEIPVPSGTQEGDLIIGTVEPLKSQLQIHKAHYGIGGIDDVDVRERLQSLAKSGSLDIVVNNDTLTPGGNPFRGKRKQLNVTYSINGGDVVTATRQEKEWLIIGKAGEKMPRFVIPSDDIVEQIVKQGDNLRVAVDEYQADIAQQAAALDKYQVPKSVDETEDRVEFLLGPPLVPSPGLPIGGPVVVDISSLQSRPKMSAAALNDYLIRKFHISDRRLRAPMPVELRDFNRNDLAKLFAELGFTRGAEIGVAEGHYSEILCQSIPNLELLCVDPWHKYDGNPRAHSEEHQQFSLNETKRKLEKYNVQIMQMYSMDAVRDVAENSLDFVYIDGNHQFSYAMSDLIEWGKRVRSGGVISGDDYYAMKHQGGVVTAVDAYVKGCGINLWFICDAPNSVDFFWVKP